MLRSTFKTGVADETLKKPNLKPQVFFRTAKSKKDEAQVPQAHNWVT